MKTILPFYPGTFGLLDKNHHTSLIEAYWTQIPLWFKDVGEDLIIVCDETCWYKSMDKINAKIHFVKTEIADAGTCSIPINPIVLDELVRLKLIEPNDPIMIIDSFGRGLLPEMRQAARKRYTEIRQPLMSVQLPADHPGQVQTYYFIEPLGFGFFPAESIINENSNIVRVDGRIAKDDAYIRLNHEKQWELFLPLPFCSSSERLLLFAFCYGKNIIPLQIVKSDDLKIDKANDQFQSFTFVPVEGMQALLAFHVALQEEGLGISCCSSPVIFDESLWTYGSPGHLYAVTPCKNTTSGKIIHGRQDLPPLFAADWEMAVGTPEDLSQIDRLSAQGRCCGFQWTGTIPTLPSLMQLLRSVPPKNQEQANPIPGMMKTIFPEHKKSAYMNYLEQLNSALINMTHENGESAVLVKGLLDFLLGVSELDQKPKFMKKAIANG